MSGDVQDLTHFVIGDVHSARNLELGWLSLENLLQSMPGFLDAVDRLADMNREPNRAALIGDGARDGLANPPRRVGGEFEAPLVVELIGRLHESDVAFLDEIEEGEPATDIFLGNRYDESKIRADQMGSRQLTVEPVGVENRSLLRRQVRI